MREHGALTPPGELRSAGFSGAKKLGRGEGYRYPHEDPAGFDFDCLPERLRGRVYYEPSGHGEEQAAERSADATRE